MIHTETSRDDFHAPNMRTVTTQTN